MNVIIKMSTDEVMYVRSSMETEDASLCDSRNNDHCTTLDEEANIKLNNWRQSFARAKTRKHVFVQYNICIRQK